MRMRLLAAGSLVALLPLLPCAYAQQPPVQDVIVVGPDTKLGANAGKQNVVASSKDLRADWESFLKEQGIHEGQNAPRTPDQSAFQIFKSIQDVKSRPNDPNWLAERANAYQAAILDAKKQFAEFLTSEVKSDRLSSVIDSKGQGVPELGTKTAGTLSVFDKMRTLADKALDAQIK